MGQRHPTLFPLLFKGFGQGLEAHATARPWAVQSSTGGKVLGGRGNSLTAPPRDDTAEAADVAVGDVCPLSESMLLDKATLELSYH